MGALYGRYDLLESLKANKVRQAFTERLGLEASGGMVRVGPVHYNTLEEIQRFGEALRNIAAGNK